MLGKKWGRLRIIKLHHMGIRKDNNSKRPYLLCKCDCGKMTIVRQTDFPSTKSCGCYRSEFVKKFHTIHGMKYTSIYRCWNAMKDRCLNPKSKVFHNYGARGISVSKSWYKFLNFQKDMQKSYFLHVKKYGTFNTTLDRINNNGGYSKKNCRWATRMEQAQNTRKVRFATINGVTHSFKEWGKIFSITVPCFAYRMSVGKYIKT
jgi:hypothetical protein